MTEYLVLADPHPYAIFASREALQRAVAADPTLVDIPAGTPNVHIVWDKWGAPHATDGKHHYTDVTLHEVEFHAA